MEFGIIRPEKVAPPFVKATEKEEKFLEVLLHREGSHLLQWRKHLQAFASIIFSLLINFLRGSKRAPSIIEGFERCSGLDWGMFALFILISMSLTVLGVIVNRREQALKEKVGKGLVPTDIRFKGVQLAQLIFGAFIGGWVGGALGLGGGSIFNPLMISMGVPPQVSTSTGMYMIMYSTLSSSVIYVTYGSLDIPFSLWLGAWGAVGTILGLKIIGNWIKKSER